MAPLLMCLLCMTRCSGGFAFVYFENVNDAREAKECANGMELDGHRITVDFSITKRPHTPTPGIYMGRPTCGSARCRDYYDRGYDRGYDDPDYYSRSYREGGGGGGGWRGNRFTEGSHPLLTTVVEDTGHVLGHDPTHLVAVEA